MNDSDVSAALKYIRRESGRDIAVADVADAVAISRRSLEKRFFREVVGRTVLDEIERAALHTQSSFWQKRRTRFRKLPTWLASAIPITLCDSSIVVLE